MAFNYQAIINSINNFAAQHGLTMYAYTANFKGVIEALDNLQNIQFSVQDGTIVNADVNINAAIDGTKISPNFGNQTLVTTGNVGVGTTSPSHGKLTLYDSASAPFNALVIQQGNTGSTASDGLHIGIDSAVDAYITHKENRAIAFGTANTERMRIDSSGNVGIGAAATVTSGGTTLQTTGSTFARMLLQSTNASGRKYGWYTDNAGIIGLYDYTANSERMRIDSSGNVGIGTTAPAQTLHLKGSYLRIDDANQTLGTIHIGAENGVNTIYSQAANAGSGNQPLRFVIGNSTERMRIDSSGNVGINLTPSGNSKLQINGSMRFAGSGTASDSSNPIIYRVSGQDSLAFASGNSERMRIDSSGRLLVGTSSAPTGGLPQFSRFTVSLNNDAASNGGQLNLAGNARGSLSTGDALGQLLFTDSTNGTYGSIQCQLDGTPGNGDYPGRLVFSTTADGASSPTERMRIGNNGIVRIMCDNYAATPGAGNSGVQIANAATASVWAYNNTTAATHIIFANANGNVGTIQTSGSSTSYNTSSDYRLKENIAPVTDGITRLQQLKPSRFNFIADPDTTLDGFLAHEVQTIVPEAITGEKDAVDDEGNPKYQGIDQSKLVPLLTAALQEAIGEIESLKARVAALEAS